MNIRRRILTSLAGAVALLGALLPNLAAAEVPANQIPASLQAAIKAHVESRGQQYVGLCRDANQTSPLPVGKWCAFVLSIEHDIAEVTVGPVATNDIHRVNFVNQNGTWKLQGSPSPVPSNSPTGNATPQPANTPRPPATGSGIAEGSGPSPVLLIVASAVALAAGGLTLYSASRRA